MRIICLVLLFIIKFQGFSQTVVSELKKSSSEIDMILTIPRGNIGSFVTFTNEKIGEPLKVNGKFLWENESQNERYSIDVYNTRIIIYYLATNKDPIYKEKINSIINRIYELNISDEN